MRENSPETKDSGWEEKREERKEDSPECAPGKREEGLSGEAMSDFAVG